MRRPGTKGFKAMIIRTSLLAGAGALAMLAVPAAAKPPVRHRAHAAAPRSDETAAEIKALREEVEALKARLDDQENQQSQTQAVAVQAQTQAQAAQVQAATVSQAVPDEVKTALAAQPKPKPQWFDSTTISGRSYINFSNIQQKVNGVKPAGNGSLNGTGFNIKRFYLGVDHVFSPIFAANVTMDVSNVVGQTSNTNFTSTSTPAGTNLPALVGKGFYIKKAYLQAKLSPAFIIRAGSADLPWVPYDEGNYGFRYIENTLIDRTNFGTSADWGIHVLGDLAGGLFSYQFSVVDGGGYRNVKVTKSVDFEGRVSASYKGFYAAAGGYSGKRANDTQSVVLPAGLDHVRTATRIDAMAGYKTALFNVGGEYFHAKNWNNTVLLAEDKSDGYSAFGNVNFAKQFSVFGRYDRVKPAKLTNDNLRDEYYNVGIQWEPVKIVDLAIVYKHEKVSNGTFGTQNGTIGGPNPAGALTGGYGNYSEIGVFGQFRF